jgi:hypothetical protein
MRIYMNGMLCPELSKGCTRQGRFEVSTNCTAFKINRLNELEIEIVPGDPNEQPYS